MKLYIHFIVLLALGLVSNSCTKKEPNIIIKDPIITNTEFHQFNIIFSEPIPIDKKIGVLLHHYYKDDSITYDARIERRGGFSISFPKHSYEIDLNNDVSLADLPPDDDWILNANFIDKTFLRHVLSYEIFNKMHSNNLSSQTSFVEVMHNNVYNGFYVLMEKLDKSSLNVEKNDPTASIFKEPNLFRTSYENVSPKDPNNFHQQTFPEISKNDKTEVLERHREFILQSTDSDFTNQIGNIFDIQSIIDWHLLLLISNNSDGILKNFYLYKIDSTTPIRIAPWDYDHSFGRDGDNELNLDTRPLDINVSILFARLLKFNWYKSALKNRWNELNNNNLLSVTGLKDRIKNKIAIIKPAAEKNFEIWPLASVQYYDDNNFEDEIEIMYKFIEIRHIRLTKYFHDL